MRSRSLIAFSVGAVLFAVVPYFDSKIPGEGEGGELIISIVLGLAYRLLPDLVGSSWLRCSGAPSISTLIAAVRRHHLLLRGKLLRIPCVYQLQ